MNKKRAVRIKPGDLVKTENGILKVICKVIKQGGVHFKLSDGNLYHHSQLNIEKVNEDALYIHCQENGGFDIQMVPEGDEVLSISSE